VNVLAVVLARGGSRGVPGKNVRALGPLPLLGWSLRAAYRSNFVTDVVVSTEDREVENTAREAFDLLRQSEHERVIAAKSAAWQAAHGEAQAVHVTPEARRWGIVHRPRALATDEAATDDVLLHALESWAPAADVVVTLQPTQPFRPTWLVDACVELLLREGLDSVFTGRPAGLVWERDVYGLGLRCLTPRVRRQDLRPEDERFTEDGVCYATRAGWLRASGRRVGGKTAVITSHAHDWRGAVDIDAAGDWHHAEHLYEHFWRETDQGDRPWPAWLRRPWKATCLEPWRPPAA
jgi:CMP-N-acetylneuraminic acid synthetase